MKPLSGGAGFYGKLPSHGDFVSRRLPKEFIEPWDHWLQAGITTSREQLGDAWLNSYLVSPIWEFALAGGVCGKDAWAGVMIPSVDKVGRYFPLTLATQVKNDDLIRLFDVNCHWFEALSNIALSSLDYAFDLQVFDEQLLALKTEDYISGCGPQPNTLAGGISQPSPMGKKAFKFETDNTKDMSAAVEALGSQLAKHFVNRASIWRNIANGQDKALLLLCEGLPPMDAYLGFLNSAWPDHAWDLTDKVIIPHTIKTELESLPPEQNDPSLHEWAANLPIGDIHEDSTMFGQKKTVNMQEPAWQSHGLSVVGLRRQLNEDSVLERKDDGLWAVADGMGGHSAGDVASQAIVSGLSAVPYVEDLDCFAELVSLCLHKVNSELLDMAQSRGNGQIIGSTIVVLLISKSQFRYLWAGDSRLYRYRQGSLEQLSRDHSLYNEAISMGLDPSDGSIAKGRGDVITRAIGAEANLQIDCGQGEVLANDLFLLCSDGLDKELTHEDIAELCAVGSSQEIAQNLINKAEAKGGRDNISVIVIKVN